MEQWHVPIVTLNKILQLNSNQVVGNPQKEQVFFEGKPEQEIYRNPLHCESSNLNGCAKQTSSTTLISFECDIVICSISVVVGGAIDGAGATFNVDGRSFASSTTSHQMNPIPKVLCLEGKRKKTISC